MKFCISSHIGSYKKTYDIIIPSLIKSGVPIDDIYFFIGGFTEYKKINNKFNINCYQVNHNSFDFTGLISVVELNLQSDYWFLLHDTCYVGPRFYDSILNYDHTNKLVISLSFDLSMNIGAYSWSFLKQNEHSLINQLKNLDNDIESLQNKKQWYISNEDFYIKNYKDTNHYCTLIREYLDPPNMYESEIMRKLEYYSEIDLYKLKANWGQSSSNPILNL